MYIYVYGWCVYVYVCVYMEAHLLIPLLEQFLALGIGDDFVIVVGA